MEMIMKTFIIFIIILLNTVINAQWVQSLLNSNLGRTLYSDGTTIYAGSSQGVYYTNDIGNPWISIGPLRDVSFLITIGNKSIIDVGSSDGVYTTTNNGQNWNQATGLNGAVYALAKNDDYLFAGTWAGIGGVFRSSDNGDSWQPAGLANKGITDLLVVGNTIYAASPDVYSRIYYSTDNGANWNYGSLSYPASNVRSVFYDGTTLYACDAGLYGSTDMGATWQLKYGVTFDSTGYPTDIMLFRSILRYNGYLIAAVDFESFYISSNDGASWSSFNDGIITDWTFVDIAINGSYLWGIREFFGNAYRRLLTEIVTSADDAENSVNNFILLQNYPNPFNPSTTIKYSIPTSEFITLKVFDVLGNEVATLVDELKSAGSYEVTWNAENLSSGVYFYQLKAGNITQNKKLILKK